MTTPTNSTTSSFRGMLKGKKNRFSSFQLRGTLAVNICSGEALVEEFHTEMVPFCPLSQLSAVFHPHPLCPFQFHFSCGRHMWIPEPSPFSRAQHAPSLGLQCCWGGCRSYKGWSRVHRAFSLSELPPGVEL